MGEGVLATGQIDLAYRKAGKWTLIDFKTADLPDAAVAREAHGAQMEVYRRALATITGAPVRAALCLLRSGQLLDLGQKA
jgi:ATP-dependent exoDNAse (exonuclease V) beta subunit